MMDFQEKNYEIYQKALKFFSTKMEEKFYDKLIYGNTGWNNKKYEEKLRSNMLTKAAELYNGDYSQAVDVANYALFLWAQKQ